MSQFYDLKFFHVKFLKILNETKPYFQVLIHFWQRCFYSQKTAKYPFKYLFYGAISNI